MLLEAKVQTAKVDDFFSGVELDVVDRQVKKPTGGRPQYKCRVVRGWPGLEDLKEAKKNGADVHQLTDLALKIQLPQEDQVLLLLVVDITGKGAFRTLICELVQQNS